MTTCIEEAGVSLRTLSFRLEDVNKAIVFFGDNHMTPYHQLNEGIKKVCAYQSL